MLALSTGLLTFLKELFRRFKISSSIPVRIPYSLKWMGPVKPSVLTCLQKSFTNEKTGNKKGCKIARKETLASIGFCRQRYGGYVSIEEYNHNNCGVNCNARTTCTNSSGVKLDLGLDQDQQCKLSLGIKPIERLTERLKRVNLMPNISVRLD